MQSFRRRTYHSLSEIGQDVRFMLAQRSQVRTAMRGDLVSPAFRERLMLAVTEVNGCRYCSYYHARLALRSGVSQDDLRALLSGVIPPDAPPDEAIALAYAQHWAESNARPDPATTEQLVVTYGQERAGAIQILLRMIRTGNLTGNTFDYLLYRLSFGRMGNPRA